MHVVLDMAISPTGLIARENGDEDWLPEAGWAEFVAKAKTFNNIVMGRETYELVTKNYEDYNFDNVEVIHKVVVSSQGNLKLPEGYTRVGSPEDAVEYIKSKNQDRLFLIGGGGLNSAFLKRGLVSEIHLTINPYIIGKGRSFVAPVDFESALDLISAGQISGGRVEVKYRVLKGDRE